MKIIFRLINLAEIGTKENALLCEYSLALIQPSPIISLVKTNTSNPEKAADIQNVGPFRHEAQAIFDGPRRVQAFTAVGKGVGRHVHDRHHERAIERDARKVSRQTPG